MPSPMDTELRTQDSPVPTQTVFGLVGSMVIAPIDCTGSLSNTGLKVVPPFWDFHTPPLAAPTSSVRRSPSCTAARAAMRPLMAAEPMLRAPSPANVSESTTAGAAGVGAGARAGAWARAGGAGGGAAACSPASTGVPGAGIAKRLSGMTGFASIRCQVNLVRWAAGPPLGPTSKAKGWYQPFTSL